MIKAVIADDSALLREVLKDILERDGKIAVVGSGKNGKEAVALVKQLKPDILILDCEMPVMHGLEALQRIMSECPLPVFIFSSLAHEGGSLTIKAMEYGAVDFFLKPARGASELHEISNELVRKIEFIVAKSRFAYLKNKGNVPSPSERKDVPPPIKPRKIDLIAMGSSTGGVQAAIQMIPKLPITTKPIVWVQHMPPIFTKDLADRLNTLSLMTVKEAENGDILNTGHCYLAPGGMHMKITKKKSRVQIVVEEGGRVQGCHPSCNVLFNSVAQHFSDNAVGVILTGMGEDGKEGLVNMHNKGAFVIGQNEQSCVVYGMPKAAQNAGAVDREVDITRIADTLKQVGGFQ